MSQKDKKIVAVVNKTLESGTVMNALAHMVLALGATVGKDNLHLVDYQDADNNLYPSISKMPFIVLRATSNKIKALNDQAESLNVEHITFTDAMTSGTWQEQLDRSKKTVKEELVFYGIVLFGEVGVVGDLTKKFSLWK